MAGQPTTATARSVALERRPAGPGAVGVKGLFDAIRIPTAHVPRERGPLSEAHPTDLLIDRRRHASEGTPATVA